MSRRHRRKLTRRRRRRTPRPPKYGKLLKEPFPMFRIKETGSRWIPRRFIDELELRPVREREVFFRRERERKPGMKP
jgi:hypothetical protein